MSTMDRMMLIRGHLEAVSRGRGPSPERIGVWLRELQGIDDAELDDCIREARAYHVEACDRGRRYGQITPDDVLSVWRSRNAERTKRNGTADPPENPNCPIHCEAGQVVLVGSDGYDFVTLCGCSSGDWWANHSKRWAKTTRAQVYLENPSYKLARPPESRIPPEHVEWLQARSGAVGYGNAIKEYRAHMARAKAEEDQRA